MTRADIRAWATRVVDMYAHSVSMTLPEQGELERAVAAEFVAAAPDGPVGAWVEPANAALTAWEAGHKHRGSRVLNMSVDGKQVTPKPRRLW